MGRSHKDKWHAYWVFAARSPNIIASGFMILRTPKCRWSEGIVEKLTRKHIRVSLYRGSGVGKVSCSTSCEWQNHDRRSSGRRGKKVSVDLYRVSGIRGTCARPLDS
jgi:hypothetical protein